MIKVNQIKCNVKYHTFFFTYSATKNYVETVRYIKNSKSKCIKM